MDPNSKGVDSASWRSAGLESADVMVIDPLIDDYWDGRGGGGCQGLATRIWSDVSPEGPATTEAFRDRLDYCSGLSVFRWPPTSR